MAEYTLGATNDYVIRNSDGATIPNDPANRDWTEYKNWLRAGGIPDPYVPPPPVTPMLTPRQFIQRFTSREYQAVKLHMDAPTADPAETQNWDALIGAVQVDVTSDIAISLKSKLVAENVLTQPRADLIFAVPPPPTGA